MKEKKRNMAMLRLVNDSTWSKVMRICFVLIEYPPFIAGGAGVYAECLCQELAKLDHEVHVLTPQFDVGKSVRGA